MDENTNSSPQSFEQDPADAPQRKKKSAVGISAFAPAIVWLTAVFLIGALFGNLLWLAVADVLAFGRTNQPVEITVAATDTIKDIANTLKEQGLIRYPRLFRLFTRFTRTEIAPGTYQLNTIYDYPAIVDALTG